MSALALPISNGVEILALAFAMPSMPSAPTAAACRSLDATATPIAQGYGMLVPAPEMVVFGASAIAAGGAAPGGSTETAMPPGGTAPPGTRIAALSEPLTATTKVSRSITTGGAPGRTPTAVPEAAPPATAWSSAPANRYPRGSGGSDASGAISM